MTESMPELLWERQQPLSQIAYVVEIAADNGAPPVELIENCYRLSTACLVVFILNGVSPQTINMILDPIVPNLPLNIPGVLYVDINDEARVRQSVLSSETILARTQTFHRMVARYGLAGDAFSGVDKIDGRIASQLESRARSWLEIAAERIWENRPL
jgi:hypothetical protein